MPNKQKSGILLEFILAKCSKERYKQKQKMTVFWADFKSDQIKKTNIKRRFALGSSRRAVTRVHLASEKASGTDYTVCVLNLFDLTLIQ